MRNRATNTLSKGKIRQSWSKYNLYNMQRFRSPPTINRTFFQQKWSAKAASRAYHGEQVREGQWKRMFNHRIRSVIPMNASDLAADDGSQASSGRGSGLDMGGKPAYQKRPTPYTQMTFAPLERRLDVAIFRALFASSARQARQFVIHGAVTVNGQKMKHPSYLLNPGDLFQVEPERVMYATGHTKTAYERRQGRLVRRKAKAQTSEEEVEAESKETAEEETKETAEEEAKETEKEDPKETLKALMAQAKSIMSAGKDTLAPQRKQELRGFQQAVRRVLSRSESSTVLADSLEAQFSQLTLLLKAKRAEKKPDNKDVKLRPEDAFASDKGDRELAAARKDTETAVSDKLSEAFSQATLGNEVDASELSDEEFETLKRALTQMRDNPLDNSKTYSTPWQPRQYMSAFAFIPRYLEVNQNICAAVYLRHPVARPGSAEVPTPFGETIATPAYGCTIRPALRVQPSFPSSQGTHRGANLIKSDSREGGIVESDLYYAPMPVGVAQTSEGVGSRLMSGSTTNRGTKRNHNGDDEFDGDTSRQHRRLTTKEEIVLFEICNQNAGTFGSRSNLCKWWISIAAEFKRVHEGRSYSWHSVRRKVEMVTRQRIKFLEDQRQRVSNAAGSTAEELMNPQWLAAVDAWLPTWQRWEEAENRRIAKRDELKKRRQPQPWRQNSQNGDQDPWRNMSGSSVTSPTDVNTSIMDMMHQPVADTVGDTALPATSPTPSPSITGPTPPAHFLESPSTPVSAISSLKLPPGFENMFSTPQVTAPLPSTPPIPQSDGRIVSAVIETLGKLNKHLEAASGGDIDASAASPMISALVQAAPEPPVLAFPRQPQHSQVQPAFHQHQHQQSRPQEQGLSHIQIEQMKQELRQEMQAQFRGELERERVVMEEKLDSVQRTQDLILEMLRQEPA
ncbi:hypothetical protein DTO006G1_459 [Penicillium roqueforti]|nr:hypothetical protein CBS147337_5348 [Penicillium roqueforti]KAI2722365.1 hypothetical protein CBS147354_5657 [Penicillium roqueforti]KAI2765159.1 hypothetical protein DTO006G1_459 [Penicillium roqueforti]KAI3110373.1 hypothetical protein CBS147333_4916 [Penicillium roqueforti]KAI3256517.1 hypothetical protein DTO006G7_3560 [Penicillium roqueforti]